SSTPSRGVFRVEGFQFLARILHLELPIYPRLTLIANFRPNLRFHSRPNADGRAKNENKQVFPG
ncbi:hypothetical protein KR51_00024200, partial [Rubidibacter lacunae KORDI 51-2]